MKALTCHTDKASVLGWRRRAGEGSGVEGAEGAPGRGSATTRHSQRSRLWCGPLAKPQPGQASRWCWALGEELGLEKAPGAPSSHVVATQKRVQRTITPHPFPSSLVSCSAWRRLARHPALCPYPPAPGKQQLCHYAAFPLFSTDTRAAFSPQSQNPTQPLPHSHQSPPGKPPWVPPCQRPHAEPASVPTLSSC